MIAYTLVGTEDRQRATAFYDQLLAEVGAERVMDLDRVSLYAIGGNGPFFGVAEPYDGETATCGNGCMVSFAAPDQGSIDRLYAKAIELGATDEGVPGPRRNAGLEFYAGYFRDLDGNKLNFFHM